MPVGPPGHGHPHNVEGPHNGVSPSGLPPGVSGAERKALGDTLRDAAGDDGLGNALCASPVTTVQNHTGQPITQDHIEKLLGMDAAGIPSGQVGRVLRIRIQTHQKFPGDAPGHHNLMCSCD